MDMHEHEPQCPTHFLECCHSVVLNALEGRGTRSNEYINHDVLGNFRCGNYILGTLYPPWWLPSVPGFLGAITVLSLSTLWTCLT
jgi:hypothetical protein